MRKALCLAAMAALTVHLLSTRGEAAEFRVHLVTVHVALGPNVVVNSLQILRNLSASKGLTILDVQMIEEGTGVDVTNLAKSGCPFRPGGIYQLPFTLDPLGTGVNRIAFQMATECSDTTRTGGSVGPTATLRDRGGFATLITVQGNERQVGGGTLQTRVNTATGDVADATVAFRIVER